MQGYKDLKSNFHQAENSTWNDIFQLSDWLAEKTTYQIYQIQITFREEIRRYPIVADI